ncbi:MAG: phosphoribosyltransferase [Burkholderiaceae bacterium]
MEMYTRFKDRIEAGELVAQRLMRYAGREDVIVLALPRGGVPVGYVVANALEVPLDVLLVRKLGFPGREEYAMGAIASGGVCVVHDEMLERFGISLTDVEEIKQRELKEIARREKLYRANRPVLPLQGRVVIIVDDGIATGSTMQAAVKCLRQSKPARLVIAVPVAPPDTYQALRPEVDEFICLSMPEPFFAVGTWYKNFGQTSDEEVTSLLARADREHVQRQLVHSHEGKAGE